MSRYKTQSEEIEAITDAVNELITKEVGK